MKQSTEIVKEQIFLYNFSTASVSSVVLNQNYVYAYRKFDLFIMFNTQTELSAAVNSDKVSARLCVWVQRVLEHML